MATINTETPMRGKRGVRQAKRHSLKTDMTPMVDLGFLLITFFVMTVQMSRPGSMRLNMPTDGTNTPVPQSDALTIMLGANNTIYCYNGDWYDAIQTGKIITTNYSDKGGLRDIIIQKQKWLDINRAKAEGRNGLMLIIKPTAAATYKNVVDAIDEVTINDVKKYVMVNPSLSEREWIRKSPL